MSTLPFPTADRSSTLTGETADPFRLPRSHEEWVALYQYRLDAYYGETYTQTLIKDLQLFRALDDNGKVIAITRRLFRDVTFVVDVATSALALDQLTLTPTDGASQADADLARAIWKRSQPERFAEGWARTLTACGDFALEPVRFRRNKGPGTIGFGTRRTQSNE